MARKNLPLVLLSIALLLFGCAAALKRGNLITGKRTVSIGFFADQYFRKTVGEDWCQGAQNMINNANVTLGIFNIKAGAAFCDSYTTDFKKLFRFTTEEKDRLERKINSAYLTYYFDEYIQNLEKADYYVLFTNLAFTRKTLGHISYSRRAIIINRADDADVILKIFLHEFGHAVGCEHSFSGRNLMNENITFLTPLQFDSACEKELRNFAQ